MPKGAGKNGNGGGPAGQGAQATPAPAAGGWSKKSRENLLDFWWFLATRAQHTAWRSSPEAIRRVVGRKAKQKEKAKAMNKIMRILVPCLTMIDGFGNLGV